MGGGQSRSWPYEHHVAPGWCAGVSALLLAISRNAPHCDSRSPVRRFSGEQCAAKPVRNFTLPEVAETGFQEQAHRAAYRSAEHAVVADVAKSLGRSSAARTATRRP